MTIGRGAVALISLAVAVLAAAVFATAAATAGPVTVEIHVRYSHYSPATVRVPIGRPVRFVLVNEDPIDHEWIVGDAAVHDRHRNGTEARHDARSTEVTINALSTSSTTITFDEPDDVQFICHLPGHEQYGMVGTLIVSGR